MEFPDLNADALSSLTKKIQTNLKKPANKTVRANANGKHKVDPVESSKTANGNDRIQAGKKRLRDGQVNIPASTVKDVGFEKKPERQMNGSLKRQNGTTNKTNKTTTVSREGLHNRLVVGKSRPKAGNTQAEHALPSNPEWGESKVTQKDPPEDMRSTSRLEDEVLLLGGTQDDIDLIENLGSDSEVEGPDTSTFDPKVLKSLQRLVKEVEVHKVKGSDSDVSSEDEVAVEQQKAQGNIATMPSASLAKNPALKPKQMTGSRNSKLVFVPRAEWHTADLPPLPVTTKSSISVTKETIDRVQKYARQLLDQDNEDYGVQNKFSSSAHQFYSTIMTAGTLSDKISALTLSVQESPVHNMKALDALIALAKKRSRGQAVEVLGALKDLLGPGSLLPSDRKLKAFATQPGLLSIFGKAHKNWTTSDPLPAPLQEIHLVSWAYEDWLKTAYFEILKIIESWCNDEIVFARGKAVDQIYELLRDKPEQEANLLRLLVNKLGDSDKKISSKTSYNIIQLETSHPFMKSTIINSIESDLLFRPGQSMHAKYYAVITLNQTVLSAKEEEVAKKLLEIYFALFLSLLAKPEPKKSTVPSADVVTLNKKGERQGGGGAPGKRAQQKLIAGSKPLAVDEEYREKMVSAVLTGVNRAMPYANTDDESFDKHIDTLFRVTHSSNFNTSIQALMLIQQLCGSHQAASDRFYRTLYESLLDPRLLSSSKQAMYLNLLFKALRADLKVKRVEAFAKRLLQVVAMHQPPFACAVIYLLRELEAAFPNLQSFLDQPEEEDSEDEENFRDVDKLNEADQPARALAIQIQKKQESKVYDGRKREPEYSNAEKSCLWEIDPFLLHYHPSVALFASKLLTHEVMPAKPDLSMHTLIHFLDRFVYRNPKKAASGPRGVSIMQPLAGGDTSGLLVSAQSKTRARQPVNTEAFWKMEAGKVDADEVFFHKYFGTLGKGKLSAKNKKAEKKRDADEESGGEENEDEIWEALVSSRPEIEGSEPSDDDLEMEDLDSEFGSDSGNGLEEPDLVPEEDVGMSEDDGEEGPDFDDDDALLDSDDEVPDDLSKAFESEVQFAKEKAAVTADGEKTGKKRRRFKNLPTFASVEDYAAMLEDDDDDGREEEK
ncbi:hypothetical protein MMC26_004037 [Xylographa opegraphella]|nr:hypothetical protein [Xylographa opegraphella]